MAGMVIERDVPVPADDGVVLRADVFRPSGPGRYPVLLSYGPYAKGLAFQDGYADQWQLMVSQHPEVARGSSGAQQNWEVVDPEKWVPDGYACVRVDSRGAGRSPGVLEPFSPRETRDLYECIEWAAGQPWSTGKIGLTGISYYAMNQWHVAALRPPHLAAICVWEGAADFYRDATHHGGILCTFWRNWYDKQVTVVQHGMGERGPRSRVTGEPVAGPETLTEAELAAARVPFGEQISDRPLDGEFYRQRSADYAAITVPLLSAANWGGQGLHSRGNFEGLQPGRVGPEVAGSARPGALDALLHGLRDRPAEAVLRLFPARRRPRLAGSAAGPAAGPHAGRVHPAWRAGVAAGPHPVAAALPAPGAAHPGHRAAAAPTSG